ncbi:hypothetical protein [Sphingomonas pituitosa]|uniref:hypothetical protein n=1 Tax=Sphingomonas pituitosa TaxID=99597 RepID=UPI000AB74D6A|nr:hypothetical protein [Sphingomonas pituitosa]
MACGTMNAAQRRYMWRFLPAMGVYSVVIVGSGLASRWWHPEGFGLFALALAPALPLLAAIAAIGLYLVEEKDEYLRSRNAIAAIGGLGILLAFTTVWGFLEEGGVVGRFPLWGAFPLWAAGLGVCQGLVHLRDGSGGEA